MRAFFVATAIAVAPTIARAQASHMKPCSDGTSSSRSTFACWGHGGVETTHAAATRHAPEPVQSGLLRAKHTKSTAGTGSKATVQHAKAEHREQHAVKKKLDEGHRGWLPWHHKKAKEHDAKKTK